jgi:hypothetical protein
MIDSGADGLGGMTTMRIETNKLSVANSDARLKAIGMQLSALFVLVSLAACGGGEKESAASDQQTPGAPGSAAGSAAPAATAPAKTYGANDVVEVDGWTVVVRQVQPKWVSESARSTAGSRLVAVELQVTNKGQKVRNSPIPGFCTLVQSPGAEHLGLLVMGGPSPRIEASNIPPNETRTGWATFQASDMAGLLLQCEPGTATDATVDLDTKLIWNLGL